MRELKRDIGWEGEKDKIKNIKDKENKDETQSDRREEEIEKRTIMRKIIKSH